MSVIYDLKKIWVSIRILFHFMSGIMGRDWFKLVRLITEPIINIFK